MIAVAQHIGFGWVAERSNATVLKTVEGATLPGVRIPPHPPGKQKKSTKWWIFYFSPGWGGMGQSVRRVFAPHENIVFVERGHA